MNQAIDRTVQSLVDNQLMEQGAFTPLEMLMVSGRLVYTDYERWRLGEVDYLDQVLLGSPRGIEKQLKVAVEYARSIGLVTETQAFLAWPSPAQEHQTEPAQLKVSEDEGLEKMLSQRFISRQDLPQLDMFFDNPVVVLVNGIAAALVGQTVTEAERLLDQLYQQAPNHADLSSFDRLIAALRDYPKPVLEPQQELSKLKQLSPLAKRLLSAQSRDYLVPLWRRLAQAFAITVFDPNAPELHASYALARAQDWVGVSNAILNEEGWWSHIALCLRLAQAGYLRQNRIEGISAWCYLCWQYPANAAEVLNNSNQPDPGLTELWKQFLDVEAELELDEPLMAEDFPAWLLLREPGLAHALPENLPQGETPPERLFKLIHRLIQARHGQDEEGELQGRQKLLSSHPALFNYYKAHL